MEGTKSKLKVFQGGGEGMGGSDPFEHLSEKGKGLEGEG